MNAKLNKLFSDFLHLAASSQKLGIHLIRVAILVISVSYTHLTLPTT